MEENVSRALKEVFTEDSRPRELAMKEGVEACSTAQLLAILIGSGSRGENVVELCNRILLDHDEKLFLIARRNYRELVSRYKGIGEVKAIEILAALELACQMEDFDELPLVTDSKMVYDYLRRHMNYQRQEEIWVLLLDRGKHIFHRECLSRGSTTMVPVDVKMVLKPAIEMLADCIILAHNHPSDTPRPSKPDDELTRRVSTACKAVEIPLLDHIIVCRSGKYYSYLDNGRL